MSVAVAYPFAVAAAAEDAAIVAGGVPLAFIALAWYAYYAIHHDPQWSQSGGSGGNTNTPPTTPNNPAPAPPGKEDPVAVGHAYVGFAHPVRGLVGLDTYLGNARHPVPCAIPEHVMSIPRRAMRFQGPRGPPDSPARRITRSMTRAAKRAGELMESPRVRRTMQGVYHHTSVNYDPPTRHGPARISVRHHPYRAAAHAFGFGHLAHLIP